jgi:hypothetical protein
MKLVALTSFAAGYVLGAKAGRERYEQIRSVAMRIANNPRVQETAHSAADKAREQAPVVGHKLADAAGSVAHKTAEKAKHAAHIGTHNGHGDVGDRLNPDSTHFQENPYPQGDLP